MKVIYYNHSHANGLLYLKRTLAVVVLHFFISSTNKQHSGTIILEKKDRNEIMSH